MGAHQPAPTLKWKWLHKLLLSKSDFFRQHKSPSPLPQMHLLVITASYTWTCQGHSKAQVPWKKRKEKEWHFWQKYFYFKLASSSFGMCISACKEFKKLLLPSEPAFGLSHVELQKLKLNVEKVLLGGLALYWSHGKRFVSLNENGNEPGIILF